MTSPPRRLADLQHYSNDDADEGDRAPERVEEMKSPIPFRRHKLKVGHRSELVGFPTGSYPVKPAKAILSILRNLVTVSSRG